MSDLLRADSIDIADLRKAIDMAVGKALERTKIDIVDKHTIRKWELLGRRVRDLGQAETFAHNVAQHVTEMGLKADPAVLIFDKHILAGFFPVERNLLISL